MGRTGARSLPTDAGLAGELRGRPPGYDQPMFYAAGADMEQVRRLIAAVEPDGKSVRFSLTNLKARRSPLPAQSDEPGWLVIDPGRELHRRGGFDAFRESDVESSCSTRWSTSWLNTDQTAILVMHLNKGSWPQGYRPPDEFRGLRQHREGRLRPVRVSRRRGRPRLLAHEVQHRQKYHGSAATS